MSAIASTSTSERSANTRNTIIAATLTCLDKRSAERTTLVDIAEEAGVTRATVYSYFKNKDDIIQEAMLHKAAEICERLLKNIEQFTKPEERLVEAFMFLHTEIPKDRHFKFIIDPALAKLVNEQALANRQGAQMRAGIIAVILNKDPRYLAHLDEIAEYVTRIALSLLMVKASKKRNKVATRALVSRWLLPYLQSFNVHG